MIRRVLTFTLFAGLCCAASSWGQTASTPLPPSPFGGEAFALTSAAIRTASSAIAGDHLSSATILYEETDYRVAAAGTLTYTHRLIYRIETHKGLTDWAEASMQWDPWYQKPSQIHARVLQSNGSFSDLDQKTITDAPVDSDESETYTSVRVRKAPLPSLAIGSIVEEVDTVEDKKPDFTGGSTYRYRFTNYAPAERERLLVELPSSMPFRDRISNLPQLSVVRTESAGVRRVIYEQGRAPAAVDDDIDLASTTTPLPMVEFSTGESWAAVSRDYAALSDPSIVTSEVQPLLPNPLPPTRKATIQAIVQRLHKEVRYTGVEFDEAELTPNSPAQVLKRHYGDCKDKATFLVAMLRAAGIPAHLALLSSGTGNDVNPDLPGMNRFNHAIVYIPAAGAEPALWVDATAEFSEVGTLPYEDAGRLTLIIAPDTTALTAIPGPTPQDSVLVETRSFTLDDLGPAHVKEVSETHGYIDDSYRSQYGGEIDKKTREDLEKYAREVYLSKNLTGVDHTDGANLAVPFRFTLTMEGVRRGSTGLTDGSVVIFPSNVLNSLPSWIKTAPVPLAADATAEQKQERAEAAAQRSPTYHLRPYIMEQRYRILVPASFQVRALPPLRTTPLGPATLTEQYTQDGPGVVTAVIRFTTGKSTITKQEALDFRQAVAEFYKRDDVIIGFEQTGARLLADGKVKEALATDEAAVALRPSAALPHVRLAMALLAAGVGEMARKEAARAVALEPNSAAALSTEGYVLEHDLLGTRFGNGFDREGAIAAYRKALPLHSEDFDVRFDLAVLYEFNASGSRYGAGSNLAEAIALYRDLIVSGLMTDSYMVPQYRLNLGFALLLHRDFKQVDALLTDIPAGVSRSTFAITSAVAQKDVAAGIAAADHLNVSEEDRNKGLISAGSYLARLGLYSQASAILAAGIQGQKDAPAVARQVELYRNLKRVPVTAPPVTSPDSLIFAMHSNLFSSRPDRATMSSELTPHAYASPAAFQQNLDKGMQSAGVLHKIAANVGLDDSVLRDLILGGMTNNVTGDDATGYRVLSHTIGGQTSAYFVVKEDGVFRIVTEGHSAAATENAEAGRYVLYALDHHQPVLAKSLLDWKREQQHKGGGDDPFYGELLPRFWTVGSTREGADSPEAMHLAGVSLLAGAMDIKPYLGPVALERAKATGSHATDLDILLACGYIGAEQPDAALPFIKNLLQEEPDSATALTFAGQAYAMNGDTASWKALVDSRLAKKPTDADLLRAESRELTAEHNYAAARAALKPIFDSGHVTSSDYNSYAWLGLFDQQLGPDVTDAAQKANMASKNSSFADLHTLASVNAAQGKVTEAQQVIAHAMTAGSLSQPNAAVWFTLGQLYEDYGLREAALQAYRRVQAHEFDDHRFIDPAATYLLAQMGIKRLSSPQSTTDNHPK